MFPDPGLGVPLYFHVWFFDTLLESVETAAGPLGLALIGIYSFLIAFVLPLPSEVVLVPVYTGTMTLGMPERVTLVVVMVVSGVGKAFGSVVAFAAGHQARESGPLIRFLRRSRVNVVEWSEKKTVQLARQYGYAGLAMALSVPFFPDTISIYAFSVLEEDYFKFALATFAGSVGRLIITVAFFDTAAYIAH